MKSEHYVTIAQMIAEGSCTKIWALQNGYTDDHLAISGDAFELRSAWILNGARKNSGLQLSTAPKTVAQALDAADMSARQGNEYTASCLRDMAAQVLSLQGKLRSVNDGLEFLEKALLLAKQGKQEDAPFGSDATEGAWYHKGSASAYQHALEMCSSKAVNLFVQNGFSESPSTAPPLKPDGRQQQGPISRKVNRPRSYDLGWLPCCALPI